MKIFFYFVEIIAIPEVVFNVYDGDGLCRCELDIFWTKVEFFFA